MKKIYDRYSLKSNMLKKVIFRIDYKGVIDVTPFIKKEEDWLLQNFKKGEQAFLNTFNIDLPDINKTSEILAIPVSEIEKQEIYRFTEGNFSNSTGNKVKDSVTLEISKYFAALTIDCDHYENIDPYLNFYNELVEKIKSENLFFSLKRIGIRKIGSHVFHNIESIFDRFSPINFDFSFQNEGFSPNYTKHIDVLEKNDDSPVVNFTRILDKGIVRDEEGEDILAFRVTLDLDGFIDEDRLKKNESSFEHMMKDINENYLFPAFLLSVTADYLNENSK